LASLVATATDEGDRMTPQQQPSLFDSSRLAYRGRTPTALACSRAAAVKATRQSDGFAPPQRERMVAEYRRAGEYGCTDSEMADLTTISRQSICLRRAELMKAGLVHDSGQERKNRNGCACTVWVTTVLRGEVGA
jgi:hypothetical protein